MASNVRQKCFYMERVVGIEPTTKPWQGLVLPLAPYPHIGALRIHAYRITPQTLLQSLRDCFLLISTKTILLCILVCYQHRRLKSGIRLGAVCYSTLSIPLTFRAIHSR